MPVKNGYDTCREIRTWEQKNHYPQIPIMALSANAMTDQIENAAQAGFNDYVTKPIKHNELGKMMMGLLDTNKPLLLLRDRLHPGSDKTASVRRWVVYGIYGICPITTILTLPCIYISSHDLLDTSFGYLAWSICALYIFLNFSSFFASTSGQQGDKLNPLKASDGPKKPSKVLWPFASRTSFSRHFLFKGSYSLLCISGICIGNWASVAIL